MFKWPTHNKPLKYVPATKSVASTGLAYARRLAGRYTSFGIYIMRIFLMLFLLSSNVYAETSAEKLVRILGFEREWRSFISDVTDIAKPPLSESDMDLYIIVSEHNDNIDQIINETIGWEANKYFFVEMLNEQFSESELRRIIEFYSSDVGKRFISLNEGVNQKYEEHFKSKYKEYGRRFEVESDRYSAELNKLMESYEE